jgi:hypothetical protein
MQQGKPRAEEVRRKRRPGFLGTVTIVTTAAAVAVSLASAGTGGASGARALEQDPASQGPPPVAVSVAVDARNPGPAVPADYLGLSFEVSDLAQVASYGEHGDLVALLRSLGTGVLRFGGVSSDTQIAWADASTRQPRWAKRSLEAEDFAKLRSLAQRSGWKVLLTVGLAHFDPMAAAREVASAKQALGPWLEGIEVGNEPDAYARHDLRAPGWDFARYNAEVVSYRRAIAALTPGIPIAGPGVSGSRIYVQWGPQEAYAEHPLMLTGHHYPLGCHQVPAPSITRLLSAGIRSKEEESLDRYMAVSHRTGIPFRMDETGSVSCGGQPGISNAFASALWASNYIAQSMEAEVSGINLEGNPANCEGYTPVCAPTPARLQEGALQAQPVWYALLLTKALVGDRPIRSATSGQGAANVSVSALEAPEGGLRLLVAEDEPSDRGGVSLRLHVGSGFTSATVLSLRAPSLKATGGVTLGGRAVSATGEWSAPSRLPRVRVRRGVATVRIPAASAALISLAPAR